MHQRNHSISNACSFTHCINTDYLEFCVNQNVALEVINVCESFKRKPNLKFTAQELKMKG